MKKYMVLLALPFLMTACSNKEAPVEEEKGKVVVETAPEEDVTEEKEELIKEKREQSNFVNINGTGIDLPMSLDEFETIVDYHEVDKNTYTLSDGNTIDVIVEDGKVVGLENVNTKITLPEGISNTDNLKEAYSKISKSKLLQGSTIKFTTADSKGNNIGVEIKYNNDTFEKVKFIEVEKE